ncbi:hypothetical protein N9731_00180 [Gammaproteobacteria bacterium]|nr:hypothetical protein [Gammaproteobacteria bacterium]
MKYLGILFCLVFMSSCELTPEQQANWEKFDKKLDEFNEVVGESNDILNAGNPNYKSNTPSSSFEPIQPMTTRYLYESEYLKGTQKVCVYTGSYGNKTQYKVLNSQYQTCPSSIDVQL